MRSSTIFLVWFSIYDLYQHIFYSTELIILVYFGESWGIFSCIEFHDFKDAFVYWHSINFLLILCPTLPKLVQYLIKKRVGVNFQTNIVYSGNPFFSAVRIVTNSVHFSKIKPYFTESNLVLMGLFDKIKLRKWRLYIIIHDIPNSWKKGSFTDWFF